MKRITDFLILFLSLVVLVSCSEKVPEHNTLTKAEIDEGWTLLFDGKTLDGWRSFQEEGIQGWVVEDGTLKSLGEGTEATGDIITEGQYENFELKLDWKISPQGNSGILYLVQEDTFKRVFETGPEYQLLDDVGFPPYYIDDKGDTIPVLDSQKTAANYAMHVAENKELKPVGEWNTAKILVDHGHVEHWLNGKKVVEYELWSDDWKQRVAACKWSEFPGYGAFKKGHIALQDHGSIAWFRNMKIREIE